MSMQRRITKAVFPVAGLGTRFLPATKSVPKELLPLVDRPLVQYAIDEARAAGIQEFIFVTARGKSALEQYLDQAPDLAATLRHGNKTALLAELERSGLAPHEVAFAQQDMPRGLGHAVWCARHLIGDAPFAVILPDDVIAGAPACLQEMVEAYQECGGNLVAAMDVARDEVGSYGILDTSGATGALCRVRGMVEKPKPSEAPSTLAVVGRYILEPAVLRHLSRGHVGAAGEIQLTDAIAAQIGRGGVHGFRFSGRRFDCGSKAGYLQATVAFALARPDLSDDFRRFLGTELHMQIAAE